MVKWPGQVTERQILAIEEFVRRVNEAYPNRILQAVLFGSVARGDFEEFSDVDLLLVVDNDDADFDWEVWGIGAEVSLKFDVILDPHIYSRPLWEALRSRGRPLCKNVEQDGFELFVQPGERIAHPA